MMPYLASYLHHYTDTGFDYSHSIWISCCLHAAQGIAMPLSTLLLPKVGPRPLLLVAWVIHSCGILLTGVTLKAGFGAMIFTYGIMVGWGVGSGYNLIISAASSWFPKHRGLAVGLCTCGFGLGAIIITPIQTAIINPTNIVVNNVTQMFDDEQMLQHVPKCFYILGGIMAGVQLIGILFTRSRPEEKVENDDILVDDFTDNTLVNSGSKTSTCSESQQEIDLPPGKVLKQIDFYLFWAIMCLCLIPLTLVTATIKVLGQRSIPDDKYLSMVATIGAVFNTVLRIAWGPIGDLLSFKAPLSCLNCFYGIILITLPFITPIPVAGKYLYALWIVFLYLNISGNFVLLPFGVSRAFGHKHFAANYSLVFSAFLPGSVIGALIVYFVTLEHYLTRIFIACGIICLCSSTTALFLNDSQALRVCQAINCHRRRSA
ncbi:hypothetical protein Aperf_G00000107349 [Anoplocephala perfoliata]